MGVTLIKRYWVISGKRRSGHPPFGAQVILNGHEYVAAQAQKAGVEFTKQENCFTAVSNATGLAEIADTLSEKQTAGRLCELCERWIYSTCLCFALDLAEQEKSRFQYRYAVFRMEYSRNLLFGSGRQMNQIFQALIDRTRRPLDLDRVKTIFGDKNRPHRDTRKKNPTRWGRSLPCFGEIVVRLRGTLERFLNAVGCLEACFVADETLENLPLPTKVGQTKVGGIDFNKPRMRQVAEAVLALSTAPTSPAGFTASDMAQKVRKMNGPAEVDYGPRRAAYDIKKLRAKQMVRKIGTSRRYECDPEGLRTLAALLVLREKVIRPLLAASQRPESTSKPNHPTPIDHHYEHLRAGMRDLFTALGMVA